LALVAHVPSSNCVLHLIPPRHVTGGAHTERQAPQAAPSGGYRVGARIGKRHPLFNTTRVSACIGGTVDKRIAVD
jgi:hypothetical protein